jgi:hypothetical protein
MGSERIKLEPEAEIETSQTPVEKPALSGVKQTTWESLEDMRGVVREAPVVVDSNWHDTASLKVKAVPLKVKDILREFHSCVVLGVNDVKKGQVDVPLEHPPLPY